MIESPLVPTPLTELSEEELLFKENVAAFAGSRLRPHFAAPHGDMMLSGCFGLLWAFTAKYPSPAEEIEASLDLPRRK